MTRLVTFTISTGCLFIMLYAAYSHGGMIFPSKVEEQGLFQEWKESTEFFTRPDMEARHKEQMKWIGDIQEKEKQEIFSFIASQSEFSLPGKVLKTDMDGDGIPDYVLWSMYIKNPQPYYYGKGYGVLFREKDRFKFRMITTSTDKFMPGQIPIAVDLNGDGFKEIVVGWSDEQEYDPENPIGGFSRNIIYKNDGGLFRQIYERMTYDSLKVFDLNSNGTPEILETVNEYERETYDVPPSARWYWINVYNLGKSGLELANERYPKFYEQKKKEYEVLLQEAHDKELKARDAKGLCRDGEPPGEHGCTVYFELEKKLKTYIQRINELLGPGSKSK